jgi:Ca2+-transporting ATPase
MPKYTGLTEADVSDRISKYGYNELPTQKKKNPVTLLLNIFREPMIFLLLASGLLYLFLGEPKDAAVLISSIFVVVGITYYQERKTEKALQALKDLSSPRALVIRDGREIRVPGREVVVDDVIMLEEGDRVPADAVVIGTKNLQIDESLLTGESFSVRKTMWDGLSTIDYSNRESPFFVYSGTLVVQGSAVAKVIAIGPLTEMGKIGKSLEAIIDEDSLLKREMARIVKVFGFLGLAACLTLIAIVLAVEGGFLNAFLSGLTLSMAMLPEEFPVVLLIFLTLGAWRLSKKRVLTRNNQAIETLGATTVLCVDKTGTLTVNRMEFASLVSGFMNATPVEINGPLNDADLELLSFSKLASRRHAYDPLEKEINSKFDKCVPGSEELYKDWHLVKEYGLSQSLAAVTRVWNVPNTNEFTVSMKGSPEAVIELCHLSDEERTLVMENLLELSRRGQRVLGVAKAKYSGTDFPKTQKEFEFKFLGLIGFVDPVIQTAADSVKECYQAGIRVIMITGDFPGTAQYVASQVGIKNSENFLTGSELKKLSFEELREKIKEINIFARVAPDQKLIIVEALKANGEVVAMTGDGVNDGPALKSAHIGIAMGNRGTDVARESADLVLLDDDFTSIVTAVKLGRRIYDNLQKAVSYIFSIHIPIAGIALFPTLFGMPSILFPIHVAFMELIIDPACSTVYESENSEKEIMHRKPRDITKPLFGKSQMLVGSFQGVTLLVVVLSVFVVSLYTGKSEGTARALAFATLLLCNIALIFTNLSRVSVFEHFMRHNNRAFYAIAGGAVAVLLLVLQVPFLNSLFHFESITFADLGIVICMTLMCILWMEFFKIFRSGETTLQVINPYQ